MLQRHTSRSKESGYILLAVIFAVTFMLIMLAAALPAIGTQIRRDREDDEPKPPAVERQLVLQRRQPRDPHAVDRAEDDEPCDERSVGPSSYAGTRYQV